MPILLPLCGWHPIKYGYPLRAMLLDGFSSALDTETDVSFLQAHHPLTDQIGAVLPFEQTHFASIEICVPVIHEPLLMSLVDPLLR